MEIEKLGDDINSKTVTNSKSVMDKEREFEAGNVLNQEKPNPLFSQSISEIIATIIYSFNHVPKINAKVIYSFHNSQLLKRK